MSPAFRATQQPVIQSTQASSHACQPRSVKPLCLCPVMDDSGVGRFRTRSGRQIIRFFFEWPRQEPEIVFVSLLILLIGDEGVVVIIIQSRGLSLHMCKIMIFCTLPKHFCGRCLRPLYSTRMRLPAEPLRSRSAQGNQGIVRQYDERTLTCIRLQTVVY